ncbi:hypothetical protein [Oscillatoria sp. HE19RPO]|uniref:hypothetical protein n=1 Tax=Oscillatoria sp. HE19RPO TaxID=2954806 RepID=UPI0020C42499|nr:hypothetical protein [Oscillatoria sp. HE19RPO]
MREISRCLKGRRSPKNWIDYSPQKPAIGLKLWFVRRLLHRKISPGIGRLSGEKKSPSFGPGGLSIRVHPIRYFLPGLVASGKGVKIETAYLPLGQETAIDGTILAQFLP